MRRLDVARRVLAEVAVAPIVEHEIGEEKNGIERQFERVCDIEEESRVEIGRVNVNVEREQKGEIAAEKQKRPREDCARRRRLGVQHIVNGAAERHLQDGESVEA